MPQGLLRVVVTGCGLVTPLGVGVQHSWSALVGGRSGIRKIPEGICDVSALPVKIAGLVPGAEEIGGLNLEDYITPRDIHKMDRFIHLAMVASAEAIADSGLDMSNENPNNDMGVMIGSGIGGLPCIEQNIHKLRDKGVRTISPFFMPSSLANLAAGQVSIKHGLRGPNSTVSTACATGAHAIGDAARIIQCGDAKAMIAGGTESVICPMGIGGFVALRALCTSGNEAPELASRPWDKKRDGFVMGEGCGVLVLEEYEHAKKRGAKIYAELSGYGLSGDAYHITAPSSDGEGGLRSMQMALRKAGLCPDEIDYINAHGTSTPVGDEIELIAIKRLFEGNAGGVAISSTKSSIGHLLGAAGGVEAVFSIMAMQDDVVPPTLNLDDPADEAIGLNLVPKVAQKRKVKAVLSNSFGFGGTNASLIFTKIE
ncbi:MAG: beta-ketoacyl-ACP synthase II [Proteobacteria bacterium]|nr:beta-ketoacyl-ACP synthase II [Pseudomonadota bacterium]